MDFGILVVGTIVGMLLGGAIIMTLVFAAVSSAKDGAEHTTTKTGLLWSHVTKYERTPMRTSLGHDPEDW